MHSQLPQAVRGFTLVEVLVALLLLAVGVLGAAGAQLVAHRTQHHTGLMGSAVQLAGTLAERMRANGGNAGADGENPYLQLQYDAQAEGAPKPPQQLCYAASACSPAQVAAFDAYEVRRALHDNFPGGRVLVCRDAVVWDAGARALAWPCSGGPAAPLVIKLGWLVRGAKPEASPPALAVVVARAMP